ncbi:fatty acyl-CoA hydrolase precursor, medium chain-like isoform X2 [Panonychus citri]|uniref:fatty acyl-CoA hydrolase precursor, medium chain-like isoform X2 n=1 Tax=Panonychus citri TaxID=50023 RepID=UPI00230808F7|nr:fatty acyl-CoA hydrolase precursor, medium chain-like isoform X2 [Panonychus citri]
MKLLFCLLIVFLAFNQFNCFEFSEVVELPQGKIRGAIKEWRGRSTYEYKGIPYAAAPIDSLRFSMPEHPKPWEGIKDTIDYGKSCPQPTKAEDTDEDCLYMNIYVNKETFDKRTTQLKPVLFWIHGGGFQAGSGNEHDAYKGVPLVILEDVILVTFNYRLGVLGFLNGGDLIPNLTPNLGLWDQHFALKWTRDNIHRFGGDPYQITIFGQSAGSVSVSYHILSPKNKGLFKGAIMESGGFVKFMQNENMKKTTSDIIDSVGCSNFTDKLSCLRLISWTSLLDKAPRTFLSFPPTFGDEFVPLPDDEAIPIGQFNDVNLLVGAERDEGDGLVCGTYKFAVLKAANSTKSTYGYIHTQAPSKSFGNIPMPNCGRKVDKVCHSEELVYVFGAPLRNLTDYDADDIELSLNMMKIWTDFARNGVPTKQGPIVWPQIGGSEMVNLIELNNKFVGKIDHETGTKCLSS